MSKLASAVAVILTVAGASFAAAQQGEASISGTVKFEGAAKKKKINSQLDGDKYCGPQRGGQDVFNEEVIVGENNALANVLVWVKSGVKGKFEAPAEPATIDQNKCIYSPHIVIVQVGQKLQIKNSDDTMHNIHAFPLINKEFNEGQASKNMVSEKTFNSPEIGIKIKCDVHPWMGAYLHVIEHPFHSKSGTNGAFKIDKLPAGTYTIEAWHEKFGKKTAEVTVGDKEAKTQDFSFKAE